MDVAREIEELNEAIEVATQKKSELKGQADQILSDLKQETGLDSIAKIKQFADDLSAKSKKLNIEAEAIVYELKEKYDW